MRQQLAYVLTIIKVRLAYWLRGLEGVCAVLQQERVYAGVILKMFGAEVGEGSVITGPLTVHNATYSFANLRVGRRTHIGRNCFLDLSKEIVLHDYAVVSMNSTILTHQSAGGRPHHPSVKELAGSVIIGQSAYIGAGAILLAGVELGPLSVVGAGAVVTRAVPPECVVVGVPAWQK